MAITYRTTDLAQWGSGQGSNLSATQVDTNFWTLWEAVQSVTAETGVGIASATVDGDQLTFTLTDATTLGPFTLPTIALNPRGNWEASTGYAVNDIVYATGNVYLVIFDHTSEETFSAGANDGDGHDYYRLLFEIPGNTLPAGGTTGQVLNKVSDDNYDTGWSDHTIESLTDVDVVDGAEIDRKYLRWNDNYGKWVADKPSEMQADTLYWEGGTETIDRGLGFEAFSVVMNGEVTIDDIINWPESGIMARIVLKIENYGIYDSISWPAQVIWPNGTPPVITPYVGFGVPGRDIIVLVTFDGGTTVYGSVAGKNYF